MRVVGCGNRGDGPMVSTEVGRGGKCHLWDSIGAPHRGARWAGLMASAVLLAGLPQSPTRRSKVGT